MVVGPVSRRSGGGHDPRLQCGRRPRARRLRSTARQRGSERSADDRMTTLLLGRAVWSAVVVWLVATAVFVVYFAVPHDAARLVAGSRASAQTVAVVRERLGLDRP